MYKDDPGYQQYFNSIQSKDITPADLKDYDLETIKQLNSSNPEIAKTYNNLALLFTIQGDLDKAIAYFERSQQIWPGNLDAVKNLKLLRQVKDNNKLAGVSQR